MLARTLLAILLAATGLFAAGERPGAVFLMIWPGARPTSLGGAYTAVADDAFATYYNTGGLAFATKTNATLMHANWLPGLYPGMYYEFLGLARPLRNRGAVGFDAVYLTTGKTEVINDQGQVVGEYTTFDVALGPSYGMRINDKLGVGLGFKFIYSFLAPEWVNEVLPGLGIDKGGTGITWGLDAGLLYRPFPWLSVGTSLSNFGPNISYTSTAESDPLPRMLRIAARYEPLRTRYFRLFVTPELTKVLVGMFNDPQDSLTTVQEIGYEFYEAWKSIGLEVRYADLISLRAGFFDDPTGMRGGIGRNEQGKVYRWPFTYGGGVHFKGFSFDIGFDNLLYNFTTQNYKLSLSYQF